VVLTVPAEKVLNTYVPIEFITDDMEMKVKESLPWEPTVGPKNSQADRMSLTVHARIPNAVCHR
jgi:hypothetical protein